LPTPARALTRGALGAGRYNLSYNLTSFVGHERELIEVNCELAMMRLLILTGTGGLCKMPLALEVGRDLAGAYPDGA